MAPPGVAVVAQLGAAVGVVLGVVAAKPPDAAVEELSDVAVAVVRLGVAVVEAPLDAAVAGLPDVAAVAVSPDAAVVAEPLDVVAAVGLLGHGSSGFDWADSGCEQAPWRVPVELNLKAPEPRFAAERQPDCVPAMLLGVGRCDLPPAAC